MITVAAILPQTWEFRLVDRNVQLETEADWAWADLVIISGMIVQKPDMLLDPRGEAARQKWRQVATSHPFLRQLSQRLTFWFWMRARLPCRLRPLERETSGYSAPGAKSPMSVPPIPRYDLLDLGAILRCQCSFRAAVPMRVLRHHRALWA